MSDVLLGSYFGGLGDNLQFSTLPEEFSKHETILDVEINGTFYKAHVTDRPLYDPNGQKMRS